MHGRDLVGAKCSTPTSRSRTIVAWFPDRRPLRRTNCAWRLAVKPTRDDSGNNERCEACGEIKVWRLYRERGETCGRRSVEPFGSSQVTKKEAQQRRRSAESMPEITRSRTGVLRVEERVES